MKVTNTDLAEIITKLVIDELQKSGIEVDGPMPGFVHAGVSARHVHLQEDHLQKLFGPGAKLTVFKNISQPGQFAANEKVTIAGPKGKIENVRILGPLRRQSQVEVTAADTRKLGINPPVRESGKLGGTPGVTLIGPAGSVVLDEGCIISERHIHMTPANALEYGVENGQKVMLKVNSIKGGVMDNVYIRVRDDFALDLHIDTDDANAFMIKDGDYLEIIR